MHQIPERDKKGLRDFGLGMGAIIAVLFGLLLPWLFEFQYRIWPWIVGGVFVTWGLAAPNTLRPFYRGWMRFGILISRVTTPLVISIVFFMIISPTALIMRIIRRDAMARRFLVSAKSYRIASKQPNRESMEKPF